MMTIRRLAACALLACTACSFNLSRDLDPGDIRGRAVTLDANGTWVPATDTVASLTNGPVAVTTDTRGAFVLRQLPPGRYDLRLSRGTGVDAVSLRLRQVEIRSVGEGRALGVDLGTLQLGGVGALEVTLTGTLPSGTRLFLNGITEGSFLGGVALFDGLSAGDYGLALVSDDGVRLLDASTVRAGETTRVTVDVGGLARETTGNLTGRVLAGSQLAPDFVRIRLPGTNVEPFYAGPDGTFVATSLRSGVYTVVFEPPDGLPVSIPFVVVAGDTDVGDVLVLGAENDCANGGTGVGSAEDQDADGTPDAEEPAACRCRPGTTDVDDDGLCDDADPDLPVEPADTDRDGVADDVDNCVDADNPQQEDADEDGLGDACDPLTDSDDDGVADDLDNCVDLDNPLQEDADEDGLGDLCDPLTDSDDDGLSDATDLCPLVSDPDNADLDNDGLANPCDNCDDAYNPLQEDRDMNGVGDACDGPPPPPTWSLEPATSADGTLIGGTWLVTVGQPIDLVARFVGTPVGTLEVLSEGAPRATTLAANPAARTARLQVDVVGTPLLRARLTVGTAVYEKTLRPLAVLDPSRAIFFDAATGNNTNDGSLAAPKADPVAYLSALAPGEARRHLYVKAGSYTNNGVKFNVDGSNDHGTDTIVVHGGFGTNWVRDPATNRSDFRSNFAPAFELGNTPAPAHLRLDGIALTNQYGVSCRGARLDVVNSYINANNGPAVDTQRCDGLLANNVFMSNAAVTVSWSGPTNGPSNVRLFGNTVIHLGLSSTLSLNPYLGGSIVGNLFYSASADVLGQDALDYSGNVFVPNPNAPTGSAADRLARLNTVLLARENNVLSTECAPGGNAGSYWDVGALVNTGLYPRGRDPSCYTTLPLPVGLDAWETHNLAVDRRLAPRHPDQRQRGSDELDDTDGDGSPDVRDGCPLDRTRSPPLGQCTEPIEDFSPGPTFRSGIVGEPINFTLTPPPEGTVMNGNIHPSDRGTLANLGTSNEFQVIGHQVGPALVYLAQTRNSRLTRRAVFFDFRPPGRSYFIDLRATTNGDGTEASPWNTWPDAAALVALDPSTPVNLLVAEVRDYSGQRLPASTWLPVGVRVFGGYAHTPLGFMRRLPRVETNLQPEYIANFNRSLVVEAGNPADPPWKRVIDGISVGTTGTLADAALRVAGPLLMNRVRVFQTHSPAPSVLEIGAGNVAFTNGSVSYESYSTSAIALVQVAAAGAPTFLLSNLYRSYGQSSSASPAAVAPAFRVANGFPTLGGTYAGLRYWYDTRFLDRFALFELPVNTTFTPAAVFGNAIGPVTANMHARWVTNGSTGTGSNFAALEALATAQPASAPPNLVTDAARLGGFGFNWIASSPLAPLLDGAGDAAARAVALDADAPATWGRLPLDRDFFENKRSATAADVGLEEVP